MTTNEEGVQNYLNSPNFLQYSQKKDLEPKEDDFFARIKLKKKELLLYLIKPKKLHLMLIELIFIKILTLIM